MRLAGIVVAVALVLAALLLSMGANEGCLPWQQPSNYPGERCR